MAPQCLNDATVMLRRIGRIFFLDRVVRMDLASSFSVDSFEAQCLALRHGLPIQLAQMVLTAKQGETIDEMDIIPLRDERIFFLNNVFKFIAQTLYSVVP